MTELNRRELDEYLAELSALVNSYNPAKKWYVLTVILAYIAIICIVINAAGILWGSLLIFLGCIPFIHFAYNSPRSTKTVFQLSEKACILMSRCVNLYKYPGDDSVTYARRQVLYYRSNGNLALYREFISLYPHMASKKLKKLASIKLG